MLEPLTKSLNLALAKTRDAFVRDHPSAVFVVQPFAEAELGFTTIAGSSRPWDGSDPRVARIEKREGSSGFGAMITVGRATNNDICFDGPGVSKFHAYLRRTPGGNLRLFDAGSTHGTFLGDRRLQGVSDSAELRPGSTVRLGDVSLTFYTADAFYDWLRDYLMDADDGE